MRGSSAGLSRSARATPRRGGLQQRAEEGQGILLLRNGWRPYREPSVGENPALPGPVEPKAHPADAIRPRLGASAVHGRQTLLALRIR